MIGLLILGIVVIVVGLYVVQKNKGSAQVPGERPGGRVASIVIALRVNS